MVSRYLKIKLKRFIDGLNIRYEKKNRKSKILSSEGKKFPSVECGVRNGSRLGKRIKGVRGHIRVKMFITHLCGNVK